MGFFRWIDREATPFERQLICDLRDAVWKLRREQGEGMQIIEMLQTENGDLILSKEQLEKDKAEVLHELEEAKAEILIMTGKMKQENSCWFCSFIVVIIVGVLFALMFTKA